MEAHATLDYFVDAISLRLYEINYPAFCTVDITYLIKGDGKLFQCGYQKDYSRVAPLHALDPNISYSLLRMLLPNVYGRHRLFRLDINEIEDLLNIHYTKV